MERTVYRCRYFRTPFCADYWKQAFSELKHTKTLAFAAVILALRLILKTVQIPIATDVYITFGFMANAFGSMVYGPVVALLSGALSDALGFLINSKGGIYFPLYMIPEMLGSFIFALFLYSTDITHWRLILSKFTINLLVNIVISEPIHVLYYRIALTKVYEPFLWIRIVKNIVMLPLESVILIFIFKSLIPAISKIGFTPPGKVDLNYTKRHIALIVVLTVIGLASVGGYVIYDYNTKSFSASYTAQERREKNTEMNMWVAEETGETNPEETVTVILSARSTVGNREMTYELAIYRIDMEKFTAQQEQAQDDIAAGKEGTKPYTIDTLHGYSKTPASKDEALIPIGTGIAKMDKNTGERISLEVFWTMNEENKQ